MEAEKSKQSLDTDGTKHTLIQLCIPDLKPGAFRVGSDSLYIELGWMSGSCGQE